MYTRSITHYAIFQNHNALIYLSNILALSFSKSILLIKDYYLKIYYVKVYFKVLFIKS